MFVLLISNKRLVQFQLLKNSLVQINSKLNSKPYDYLYKRDLGTPALKEITCCTFCFSFSCILSPHLPHLESLQARSQDFLRVGAIS